MSQRTTAPDRAARPQRPARALNPVREALPAVLTHSGEIPITPIEVLALQRTVGNQAATHLIPGGPLAATITPQIQRFNVIQRSEDEALLQWDNWRAASYVKYQSRKELSQIDAAIKSYSAIEPGDKHAVQRLLAVERIYNLADQFTRQNNINNLDQDRRATFRLMRAADDKLFELRDARTTEFAKPEVRADRIREVVPSFYHIKDLMADDVVSPTQAAHMVFREFIAYTGFTYTTATVNKTLSTGLYQGSCEDFSSALAELFNELGIPAQTRTIGPTDFVTLPATNFVDPKCPGNIKTRWKGFAAVNRFFFKSHNITVATAVGEFDPTAGVLGEQAVDPNLTAFAPVTSDVDRRRCGLKAGQHAWLKGNVCLVEDPTEKAPTGGLTYVMKTV